MWAFSATASRRPRAGPAHVAALEALDNLTFVINCNLQRLDGPVRGNGKIIQGWVVLPRCGLERSRWWDANGTRCCTPTATAPWST